MFLRRGVLRVPALLTGAVLLSFGAAGDAFGLRDCPHHDAVPGRAAGPEVPADPAGHHAAHPGAAPHAGRPAAHPGHAPAADESAPHTGPCTCVGACHASGGAATPREGAAARLPSASVPRREAAPAGSELGAGTRSPVLHLYANPPPATR